MNRISGVLSRAAVLFFLGVLPQAFADEDPKVGLVKLYNYEPMFFLAGRPDAKVQASFQTRLIKNIDLHFAYTQLMLWDLFQKSSPIRDINFHPEIFYRVGLGSRADAQWLDLGFYSHESNGQSGQYSRSWERLYVRYRGELDRSEPYRISWSAQAWAPYALSDNTDIGEYRGLWELKVTLSGPLGTSGERDDLTLRLYGGGTSNINPIHGGQELTARWSPDRSLIRSLIIAQLFQGYGENLREYKDRRFGVRLGIGF
jgi:phospholipase A1